METSFARENNEGSTINLRLDADGNVEFLEYSDASSVDTSDDANGDNHINIFLLLFHTV
jgi:hypothetical protein